jgi:hypothetical protein
MSHRQLIRFVIAASVGVGALASGARRADAEIPTCGGTVVCGNPLGASIRHPGSARQCSEIEVVIDSPEGHEWIYAQTNPGLGPLRTFTEKCGYSAGPCTSDAGGGTSSDWSHVYRGPIHVRYIVAAGGAASVEFWLKYMGGSYTSYHYNTYNTRTVMTVTDGGRSAYLNLEVGDWRTPPVVPADGASTIPLTAKLMDTSCRAKVDFVDLRTTLGTLLADGQSGKSIRVRTKSDGTVSATLRADTTSGVADVSAAASGQLATGKAYMYGLVLTAPAELPANGTSSDIVTATLDCNGTPPPLDAYLLNKITIGISTSAGTLVLPAAGSTPAASVSGHPGPLGSLTASLQSTTEPQTANLRATSGGVEAFATTEFTGPKITLEATRTEYFSVASGRGLQGDPTSGPYPFVGEANVPYRDVVEPTWYGRSRVKITAKLSLGATPASGKTLLITSPENEAVGGDYIQLPTPPSVVTEADGTVEFPFITQDLWKPGGLAHIHVKVTFAEDPTVFAELDIKTVDNFAELRARYRSAFSSGPVWNDTVTSAVDRMSPSSQEFLNGLYPGVRNDLLLNRAYQAASSTIAANRDEFAASTSPWWQWKVLSWLNKTQWSSQWASTGSGAEDRWLLNGLDYGPLFVEGDRHAAVVIYPRGESWNGGSAQVFDPWIEQMPTSYTYSNWKSMLADSDFARAGSTGVDVQTEAFTEGMFAEGYGDAYPVNGNSYSGDLTLSTEVPKPWDPNAEQGFTEYFELMDQVVVQCPVYVTMEDGQGRKSGYAPPPGVEPTLDQVPGALRSALKAPDGTLHWAFSLPKDAPLTLRVRAYATGTMTVTLLRREHGRRWVWRNVAVTAGEEATIAFTPAALVPPSLQFGTGRSVAGATESVAAVGASDDVVVGGGEQVTIGGIVFANGGLLQQGATVRIGGRDATNVTVLNGSTLSATVPAGTAEGTADIVVTNPGGEQATLTGGFSYYLARHYFAEGATSGFFDTRLALLNPTALSADATLSFLDATGQVFQHTVTVPAMTRATVDPKAVMPAGTHEFSTVIAATQHLVADRTMKWDATGYGSHAETSLPAPATTWYLAEGATHSGFDLFYLLQNPNDAAARATVTFLLPAPAQPVVKTYDLGPKSRTNIWVDLVEGLGNTDVSARIDADQPIIVERAMYLNREGRLFGAGHESAGVTAPATSWFLAEGATGDFFDQFVLVANPGETDASIQARYLLTNATVYTKNYVVPARSRFNIWVDQEEIPAGSGQYPLATAEVSTTITSTNAVPVIVERAMWWPGNSTTWHEAHNSPGATATGTRWALAEGEVGGDARTETFILIANTSATPGTARVTLVLENGTSVVREFAVTANSRFNVAVSAEFPEAAGQRFAALVESVGATPAQLVVERAMYSDAAGTWWAAGTNALATRLQ